MDYQQMNRDFSVMQKSMQKRRSIEEHIKLNYIVDFAVSQILAVLDRDDVLIFVQNKHCIDYWLKYNESVWVFVTLESAQMEVFESVFIGMKYAKIHSIDKTINNGFIEYKVTYKPKN